MSRKLALLWALPMIFGVSSVLAQVDDSEPGDDATIRLMGDAEAELPDAVTKEIELPEDANEAAFENAADGLAKAEERHERRESGLATADEAMDNAADMADEALENAEDRGRAEDLPIDVPGRPEMPEVPQPPSG